MVTSGITSATAGSAFSRASSPADTVAARESVTVYGLTWVACTLVSSESTDAWCERISEARLVACAVPTWAEASWLLRITMTCWLTLRESWLASASVIGRAPAEAVGTPVTAPASDD